MMIRKLTCLLTVLALLLCACPALCEAAGAATAPAAEEEELTFDVAAYFKTISDLDLTPYAGKVIALHFFKTASADCTAMMPAWKLIYDDFDKEDVEIVLIHVCDGEGQQEMDALKQELGLDGMNIYEDVDAVLSTTLGVTEVPNTLFLNGEGNPASGYSGRLNYTTIADLLKLLGADQLQNSYVPKEN